MFFVFQFTASRNLATTIVFLASAMVHEYVLVVSFRFFFPMLFAMFGGIGRESNNVLVHFIFNPFILHPSIHPSFRQFCLTQSSHPFIKPSHLVHWFTHLFPHYFVFIQNQSAAKTKNIVPFKFPFYCSVFFVTIFFIPFPFHFRFLLPFLLLSPRMRSISMEQILNHFCFFSVLRICEAQ